jgi:hypothetical protein
MQREDSASCLQRQLVDRILFQLKLLNDFSTIFIWAPFDYYPPSTSTIRK